MAQLIKGTAFSPYFTGPLLCLLTAAPPFLRLPENYSAPLTTSLKWLFGLGLVGKANRWLSNWADRKWLRKDDKSAWDWKNEVAVVTGGSGGIGASVVKELVSKGVKVAVIDVLPLSDDLRDCMFHKSTDLSCSIADVFTSG
jgi:all-trans-retinol dehydrogenase (NAD+)